jgi:hypothetical protein
MFNTIPFFIYQLIHQRVYPTLKTIRTNPLIVVTRPGILDIVEQQRRRNQGYV